jgi:hypothetical protein
MRLASELKIGDTFKKQGRKFTIQNIVPEEYKNGTKAIMLECTCNDRKIVDSYFHFKLDTKIK